MARPYDEVEKLIDKYGVYHVLAIMSDVMGLKAQHIESNWQDYPLASKWSKSSSIVAKAALKLPKTPGIRS